MYPTEVTDIQLVHQHTIYAFIALGKGFFAKQMQKLLQVVAISAAVADFQKACEDMIFPTRMDRPWRCTLSYPDRVTWKGHKSF